MLEILGLLERTDIATRGPDDPQAWVEFAQASRLAYADRDRFVGDPAFTSVPAAGMTDPAYLDARAKLNLQRRQGRFAGSGQVFQFAADECHAQGGKLAQQRRKNVLEQAGGPLAFGAIEAADEG